MAALTGEEIQAKGREAARRAKVWLENSTRVAASWVNPEGARRLQFDWPGKNTSFSFDMGGILRGEPFHNNEFLAEVKGYEDGEGGQASMYLEYLAQCYVAMQARPANCDHFLWITWTPFRIPAVATGYRPWSWLVSSDAVEWALNEHRDAVFEQGISPQDAKARIDIDIRDAVVDRLWVIVLTAKQESLVITEAHRKLIYGEWGEVAT